MNIYRQSRRRPSGWWRVAACSLLLASAVGWLMAVPAVAGDLPFPFKPGERLTYVLKWEVIPAGEAVLEVLPMKQIAGQEVFHFALTVTSHPIVDPFFKVRDRIEAFTDAGMTRSLLFKKDQREGRTRRKVVVRFNWERREAQYANFDQKRAPIAVAEGTFDPLSAFYFSRLFDLESRRQIERPVTDGKRCVTGRARVLKRENITVGSRIYDTFLITPEMKHIRGVFEKSEGADIKLWVSADHRHIPIRIESRVAVGRFVGELISDSGETLAAAAEARAQRFSPDSRAAASFRDPPP